MHHVAALHAHYHYTAYWLWTFCRVTGHAFCEIIR